MNRRASIGLGVALAAAVVFTWLLSSATDSGSVDATQEVANRAGTALPDGAPTNREFDIARVTRTDEPASDPSAIAESGPFLGDASIVLRTLDAASGDPIPDLPFVVYSERPSPHVFARGITDEQGEATITRLPEDVIIVETPRRPPHANTVFATWLSPSQRKQVEIRVGRGGTVRGRVVDDVGRPLERVDVAIDPRPGGEMLASLKSMQDVDPEAAKRFATTRELITKTDTQGRYEVESILSRPSAISIESQAMNPKREEGVALQFHWRFRGACAGAKVREGEVVELPDVVMDRTRVYSGRVLDCDGRPVGGAIVSTRIERYLQLGQRAFDEPFVDERPRLLANAPEGTAFRFDLGPGSRPSRWRRRKRSLTPTERSKSSRRNPGG